MAKKSSASAELTKEERIWGRRIEKSKKYQEQFSKDWKRNEQLIYGKDSQNRETGMQVCYGYGLVKSLETSIYTQDAEGVVEAFDDGHAEKARRWSNILSYDFSVMDLKSKGNIGLLDQWIYGYFACIETLETEKQVRYPSDETPKKPGRKPKDEEPSEAAVVSQNYVSRRINPWDILFDPNGTLLDMSDHRYAFIAFYPTITALREDETFDVPEDIENYPECSQFTRREKPQTLEYGRGEGEKDPDFKTICVWEIWDKTLRRDDDTGASYTEVLYMTDHRKKIIGRQRVPFTLNIGGRRLLPITLMAFNPSPIGFYPTPECNLIAPQLTMINEMDAIIYADARTKWRKYAAFGELISPEEAAKLADPNPANCVLIVDPSKLSELGGTGAHGYPDINNIIGAIKDPAPKQDLFAAREICIQEIYDIIGYGPPGRGGMPKTRSAREAVAIKEKMEARIHLRAAAVTEFYRMFGMKHMQIVGQTLEVERYARVFVSDAKGYEYMRYSKDDVTGEFDFIVYAGSTMPRNTESKRASEREFAQLVMPFAERNGTIEPVFERLAQVYQWKNWRNIFKNHKQFLKQMALMFFAVKEHGAQVAPEQLLEIAAQVVMSGLNEAEMAELKAMAQQQAMAQGPGGPGNAPQRKPRGDQNPSGTESGVM